MAEKKVKIDVSPQQEVVPQGDREGRWAAYLENYKKDNPVKYAAKNARGEFKEIPPSFR